MGMYIPCNSTNKPQYILQINNANISLVNNKQSFRFILKEQIPEIIPKTWFNYIDPEITYPCILRPSTHAQGKHLYYCENYIDLTNAVTKVNQLLYLRIYSQSSRISCLFYTRSCGLGSQ
jgi:hypothetical protein